MPTLPQFFPGGSATRPDGPTRNFSWPVSDSDHAPLLLRRASRRLNLSVDVLNSGRASRYLVFAHQLQ